MIDILLLLYLCSASKESRVLDTMYQIISVTSKGSSHYIYDGSSHTRYTPASSKAASATLKTLHKAKRTTYLSLVSLPSNSLTLSHKLLFENPCLAISLGSSRLSAALKKHKQNRKRALFDYFATAGPKMSREVPGFFAFLALEHPKTDVKKRLLSHKKSTLAARFKKTGGTYTQVLPKYKQTPLTLRPATKALPNVTDSIVLKIKKDAPIEKTTK